MKPVLNMESGKTNFALDITGEGKTSKRSRIIVGVVVGLIAVVVVSATVVLTVHFGVKVTRDTFKDAYKTYKTMDGDEVVEKTEVKDGEVDITLPNQFKVIYDYKNELEVQRFKDPETGHFGDCYAKLLNHTEADGIKEDGKTTGRVVEEYEVEYRHTTDRVPSYRISESVRQMCQGVNIYWMERLEQSEGDERVKRLACARGPLVYEWFVFHDWGYYWLRLTYDECDDDQHHYVYRLYKVTY